MADYAESPFDRLTGVSWGGEEIELVYILFDFNIGVENDIDLCPYPTGPEIILGTSYLYTAWEPSPQLPGQPESLFGGRIVGQTSGSVLDFASNCLAPPEQNFRYRDAGSYYSAQGRRTTGIYFNFASTSSITSVLGFQSGETCVYIP